MERDDLNLYLDALLSLSDNPEQKRGELVELAQFHSSWPNLVAEWLWTNQKGIEMALFIKIWFAWSYEELGEVFGLGFREVSQLLRSQRVARLGNYPPVFEENGPQFGGVSCFMVEQQLSNWLDSEWEETKGLDSIHTHLHECQACRARLEAYRKDYSEILSARKSYPPISVEEWLRAADELARQRKRVRLQWISVIVVCLFFLGIILWMLQSQPEKMPNIYEIKEL